VDNETIRIGRERLLRVFRYLGALNEHRNPVKRHIDEQLWTLWLKELPNHPSIRRGSSPADAAAPQTSAAGDEGLAAEQRDADFILKITRPRLANPPTPPALIEPWLEAGWHNPSKQLSALGNRKEGPARHAEGTVPSPSRPAWARKSSRMSLVDFPTIASLVISTAMPPKPSGRILLQVKDVTAVT
jgi:hypothetical protein